MTAEASRPPPRAWAAASAVRSQTFERWFEKFSALDPHFARVWSGYTGGLHARGALDLRTKLLVLAGEYTMVSDAGGIADTVAAAAAGDVDLKEVLEAILQCWVYAGEQKVSDAVDAFVDAAGVAGRLEDVQARGLPVDATTAGRTLEEERAGWSPDDVDDPRLPGLLERHGWYGISTGLRLRPGNHVNVLAQLDALDTEFGGLWVGAIYEGMYARGVLDDKTRVLCMIGDCLAAAETENSPQHMRGALREGATPAEVLDVILLSTAVAGIPHTIDIALDQFVRVLEDLGRFAELSIPRSGETQAR